MSTVDRRLKYRIKEAFVRKFGIERAIRDAKKDLTKTHGIRPGTINHDINLMMCECGEVSEVRLQKYAQFLGTTAQFLKSDYIEFIREQIQP